MAKKKNKGQRNFFRFLAVLGLIFLGLIGYAFLGSAPDMTRGTYHTKDTPTQECLECHVRQVEKAPIMPHRPMGTCTLCHSPAEKA